MNKIIRLGSRVFLFFAASLFCVVSLLMAAESDITGWGKAKWGMTHSAVKKLYELNSWELGNTPNCKMKKKIKIMDRDFAVAFYFDERSASGKLYKVVLVHFDNHKTDNFWLENIKDILVAKYGNPISFDIKEEMKVSRWIKSEGQLKLTTLTGASNMCAIEYISVRVPREKL